MDQENISPLSSEKSSKINQLDLSVTRKICTGQIIISIAGACRELIDNALDAGATSIEIQTKENGIDYLDVTDNGSGIAEENFHFLCKPHSTSKLTNINDFNFLSTFGFRGEALNALASLGEVTITTRHTSSKCAFRLCFDRNGALTSKDLCPRQIGTTIHVANLFGTLPVRRQEFVRNSRHELLKMLATVQSFALSRIDCRFNCANISNGRKVQLLSTPGNCKSLKEVISSLFGSIKTEKGAGILNIEEADPDEETLALYGVRLESGVAPFDEIKLSGYVSSCEFACGRNSSDRQFIYVNKRPVDYAKLNRIANEVYGHFNRGQYCMLILFVDVDPAKLDVNVSPDKRTVFLQNEKELFAKFRASLWHTFAKTDGTCRRGVAAISGESASLKNYAPAALTQSRSSSDLALLTQMSTDAIGPNDLRNNISFTEDLSFTGCEEPLKSPAAVNSNRARFDVFDTGNQLQDDIFIDENRQNMFVPDRSGSLVATPTKSSEPRTIVQKKLEAFQFRPGGARPCTSTPLGASNRNEVVDDKGCVENSGFTTAAALLRSNLARLDKSPCEHPNTTIEDCKESIETDIRSRDEADMPFSAEDLALNGNEVTVVEEHSTNRSEWTFASRGTSVSEANTASSVHEFVRPEQTLKIRSMSKFREMVRRRMAKRRRREEFRCEISADDLVQSSIAALPSSSQAGENDDEKQNAEERLNLMLKKSDFSRMEVIGQFNNAFIFARLDDDLFMIDQHASDEKFNFERFKRRAQISTQKLISAKPLELGAVEENVLRDNIDILRANGFDFAFDDGAENGMRILLTSVPVLHGWQFDNSDIEEIVGVLADFPGVMYRPAKLRKIFASRACRKSVMFGTALTKQQMEQIIRNMGTMDQPWNCPHGRPTIRHLCTIATT